MSGLGRDPKLRGLVIGETCEEVGCGTIVEGSIWEMSWSPPAKDGSHVVMLEKFSPM